MAAIFSASRSIRSASLKRTACQLGAHARGKALLKLLTGSTLRRSDLEAPGVLESLAGGGNGSVDIVLGGVRNVDELLASGGVDGLESLLVRGLDPLVVAIGLAPAAGCRDRKRACKLT